MQTCNKQNARKGFTLIELSIVLVIIGLIVGGVLVGQDLIKAAEVRATIGQYEKYNAAINTFRTKYNGAPGDLISTQATAFGIYSSGATTTGLGNGNGLITDTAATNLNAPVGETLIFWRHLSDANLIDGALGRDIAAGTAQLGASPTAAGYFPAAKAGPSNYFLAGSSAGLNYYAIAGLDGVTGGAAGTAAYDPGSTGGLTPIQAYNIDVKLDDGMPNTGIVMAKGVASSNTVDGLFGSLNADNKATWDDGTSLQSGDCITGTGTLGTETTLTYARGTVTGNGTACNMTLRFN